MPVFHFHFASNERMFPSHEGIELPDLDAAVSHAKLAIGIAFRNDSESYDWADWWVSIRNKDGEELKRVPITETLVLLGLITRPT